jgi:hypothetical protein
LAKGIGKNLLDHMMWLLDPMHKLVTDVMWMPPRDQLQYTGSGGRRVVGAVRVVVYYGTE